MRRPSRPTQIRFDPSTYERLRAAAEERLVSVSRLVELLVEEALDRLIPVDELRLTRPPSGPGPSPEGPEPEPVGPGQGSAR